ncbi:hypothetical protein KSP39_PZI001739 [Platanthera zijinensis]|uniref:Uncharacterized protein n=1 Tax=Platanthera zijinensis TaxID=2320716 RepID=A0AAP0GEF0_9ASPA
MGSLQHNFCFSLFSVSSTLFLLLSLPCFPCNPSPEARRLIDRQTLEVGIGSGPAIGIGIGIGGGSYTPPSSPVSEPSCPPQNPPPPPPGDLTPGDFPNLLLYESYVVIQRFKKTIYSDPFHITGTWVGPDISKYRGFFLETPPRFKNNTPAIASVDFNGFRLGAPTLAGFLDQFPDLALFHANSNGFAGTLPGLTHLPYFYELDLSNNKFAGEFPSSVLPLFNLAFLDLRFNFFAGAVPPSVFSLPVEVLFLNNNRFSQPLPSAVGRTTAPYLTLANNDFTGAIPSSIGETGGTLIQVLFLGNSLSGCLPAGIGRLQKATVFDAGFNKITGPIPLSLGCLSKVEQLNFAGNLLYGEVPAEVCRLANRARLLNLSLSENYFTSLGSGCLDLLRRGILDVRKNCIQGCAGQRSPEECALFLACRKYCPAVEYVPCYSGWESRAGNHGSSSPSAKKNGR